MSKKKKNTEPVAQTSVVPDDLAPTPEEVTKAPEKAEKSRPAIGN